MNPFVERYLPGEHYGFCRVGSNSVHFHAGNFHRTAPGEPGPVLGEPVRVEGNGARFRVYRTQEPVREVGTVKSYDSTKGWGFVTYGDDKTAFLHASDFAFPWLPVISQRVEFYLGSNQGKPRACWSRPLPWSTQ